MQSKIQSPKIFYSNTSYLPTLGSLTPDLFSFFSLLLFFETESHHVVVIGLELTM